MRSGGIIEFRAVDARDATNDRNNTLDETEIRAGLYENGNLVSGSIANDAVVSWNGNLMTWAELRNYLNGRTVQNGQSVAQASNLNPQEIISQRATQNLQQGAQAANDINQMQAALRGNFPVTIGGQSYSNTQELQRALEQKVRDLQQIISQIRQSNLARQQAEDANIPSHWFSATGIPQSGNGSGNGTGSARFMTSTPSFGPTQSGPSGGAPNGGAPAGGASGYQPARGMGFDGPMGFGPAGTPAFELAPPTSAAYAQALYFDSNISDGLGQLGQSQRESRKLMMLFFYYARMAESGDPVAMYNFTKFLNFIVAKDKARQNIQIGSKLIQLQDLSRKSTEALMATDTSDPNKINDFTKALQKAKSEETTIATSQKLLADTLQEFNGVAESFANLMKGTQDTAFRIMRTLSSRA